MKLEYKILWLDDKMDVIIEGEYQRDMERHLVDEGFTPHITIVKTEADFFDHLNDSYDLIMTDYHLNETDAAARDGDKIIGEVRARSILTEIMFYSAQGEVTDTVKMDRITFVDTRKIVGGDHYEKLTLKAIELIDLTIRKFQHIVSMRGMIMNETSSLDIQMIDIISMAMSNENIKNEVLSDGIFDEINDHLASKTKFIESCKKANNFHKLTKDNYLFSSDFKIRTLSNLLQFIGVENFSQSYKDEIIAIRNKFAHAVLLQDEETGREYFKHGDTGLTFDEELCKKIRKDIMRYKKNFVDLIPHVKSDS
ncbi:hypothetical protein [Sphingobacterium deserti]|uniref:Putative prophage encoded two-component system response regulator n=1 Tax=Sphingobacterium deserti TaxID=1229276 RepID=A0A0B8T3S8_9SPHI|nr:hypothetical protein [Sphingobacterium deserti]KGE13798.1 putative prophage encoded two-component system response regulator [Sphingobacterium deserti]